MLETTGGDTTSFGLTVTLVWALEVPALLLIVSLKVMLDGDDTVGATTSADCEFGFVIDTDGPLD
jgi:hypothetical protein